MIEEIADLIVQGRNREAYEKLREHFGLSTWDVRKRHLAALAAPVKQVDHNVLAACHPLTIRKMFPPEPRPNHFSRVPK